MRSFVPLLMSHRITNNGGCESPTVFTNRVPINVRTLEQMSSTDVPLCTCRFSSRIVTRAQFSLTVAWFGQHSIGAGNFGGATRRDGSKLRQSPRGVHGGDRQLSCSVGTHTSCASHPLDAFERMQFFKPHQMLEHFGLPLAQMHELHIVVSSLSWALLSPPVLYWVTSVEFKHTDAGSDSTGQE